MKNTISSSFIIIITSLLMLMMNILNTTCSGDWNYNNSLDTFDSSPWNAPEFNDEYNSSEYTEEEETFAGSSYSDYRGPSKSVKKSKPSSNLYSGNYMFNREGGSWNQNTVEQMFVNSGRDWPQLRSIVRRKDKLLRICKTFKWLPLKPGYRRKCSEAHRFGQKKKRDVILITLGNKIIKDRIMLSCTCHNEKEDNPKKDEHTFTIAYHTVTSYFLLNQYPKEIQYPNKTSIYIMGYVENIVLPY